MNPDTLAALRASIQKWRDIAAGKAEDRGTDNCALCKRFWRYGECQREIDEKCPVFAKTGKPCCFGSPYEAWCDAFDGIERGTALYHIDHVPGDQRDRFIALAKDEAEFLGSLLPEGEK